MWYKCICDLTSELCHLNFINQIGTNEECAKHQDEIDGGSEPETVELPKKKAKKVYGCHTHLQAVMLHIQCTMAQHNKLTY